MSEPLALPPRKSYAYEWYVVFICMVAYIFSFIDRQMLALLVEPVKQDLGLTDFQFSLLHGFAFSLFYAVMGLPIARLADRHSRPLIIAAGIFFWSIATTLCGASRNFVQMFLARMGVGIGEAALSPATYSMLSDYFPKSMLGRAVGVYSMGSFIGGGLAFLIGGYVIALVASVDEPTLSLLGTIKPWQLAFFLVGLPGVFIALLFWLTVQEPARTSLSLGQAGEVEAVSLKQTLVFLRRHKSVFVFHYLGFSFYAMALFAVLGWTPAFYMRHFGLSASEVGYTLGTIVLLTNTLGVLCGGWLSDWLLARGYRDAPMRAGWLGGCGLLIPIALFPLADSLPVSLALLVLTMFFVSFPMPISTAAMQMLTPNQMRAQVSALFLFVSNLIGLGLGTSLVALLTDKLFQDEAQVGYSIALVGGIATLLTMVLLWYGSRFFAQSLESTENSSC